MTALWNLIVTHQTVAALIVAWLGSNIVSALPSPDKDSGQFYKFCFTFAHSAAGSIPRILPGLRLPSDPTKNSPTYFGTPEAAATPSPSKPPGA